jgi:2-polyprenyl-6-methoxyphenol hydroxylase-like FAD-dependent oxidoreductase
MGGSSRLGREALVVGGGIGGLAAARVLSNHFERVTILERDEALDSPAVARPGVPQGKQLHALLAGGHRALDELLPGVVDDLDEAGAPRLTQGLDLRVERPGFDPFVQRDLGFYSYGVTRPQLEFCVRRRVEAVGNIRFEAGCRVLGPVTTADEKAIGGVRCQRAGRSETRSAELVVDASGTGELTLAALRATGHAGTAGVPETTIGVDIGYSSAVFDIPADASRGWKGVLHLPDAPRSSRYGLLFPVEGHRWMLALGGRHDEHPPGDEAGLREYAATLRTMTIADAIGPAKMVSRVDRFRFLESRLRHFERVPSFPRGLLPIGDAICRFNPVFGQGMTVAALQALALARVLAAAANAGETVDSIRRPFFEEVAAIVDTPWALAAVPDFVYPRTVGERPADFVASLRFGAALTRATARHADLHKLVAEIQNLTRPRSALREPQFLQRILAEMTS